jgi:glyceraldehyde 3-phosphate dehydrogenase
MIANIERGWPAMGEGRGAEVARRLHHRTTTGAATSVGLVLPPLQGKLDGLAIRVPTPNVSVVDFVAAVERETSKAEVNEAFRKAAEGALRGILAYREEPLVSVDFNRNSHSAIVDASLTHVVDERLLKAIA